MTGSPPITKPPIWFIFTITAVGVLANTMITPNVADVLDEFNRDSIMD